MNDRVYNNGIDRLRSPERVERLEVERVVDLCLIDENIKSVLDVGTGSGLFEESFHNKNIKAAGVDLNPEMIEAAIKYLPNCEFKVSHAEEIPFEDKSFDMVFFGLVFHEVNDFKKVLEESNRIANKTAAILEWDYKGEKSGPPLAHRLSEKLINELVENIGLTRLEITPLINLVLYKLHK